MGKRYVCVSSKDPSKRRIPVAMVKRTHSQFVFDLQGLDLDESKSIRSGGVVGYHVRLTRGRSRVQISPGIRFYLCTFFLVARECVE